MQVASGDPDGRQEGPAGETTKGDELARDHLCFAMISHNVTSWGSAQEWLPEVEKEVAAIFVQEHRLHGKQAINQAMQFCRALGWCPFFVEAVLTETGFPSSGVALLVRECWGPVELEAPKSEACRGRVVGVACDLGQGQRGIELWSVYLWCGEGLSEPIKDPGGLWLQAIGSLRRTTFWTPGGRRRWQPRRANQHCRRAERCDLPGRPFRRSIGFWWTARSHS